MDQLLIIICKFSLGYTLFTISYPDWFASVSDSLIKTFLLYIKVSATTNPAYDLSSQFGPGFHTFPYFLKYFDIIVQNPMMNNRRDKQHKQYIDIVQSCP